MEPPDDDKYNEMRSVVKAHALDNENIKWFFCRLPVIFADKGTPAYNNYMNFHVELVTAMWDELEDLNGMNTNY